MSALRELTQVKTAVDVARVMYRRPDGGFAFSTVPRDKASPMATSQMVSSDLPEFDRVKRHELEFQVSKLMQASRFTQLFL